MICGSGRGWSPGNGTTKRDRPHGKRVYGCTGRGNQGMFRHELTVVGLISVDEIGWINFDVR